MFGWILGKLKWLTVLCAIGGPILAFACWQDGNRRRDVMAMGIQTEATIDSATRVKRRRGGTNYKLDLSWMDRGGPVLPALASSARRGRGLTITRHGASIPQDHASRVVS